MLINQRLSLVSNALQIAFITLLIMSFVLSALGVTTAYALAAPDPVAPLNFAIITAETDPPLGVPVFEWTGVETANTYRLQVSTSPGFSSQIINITTANTRYVPTISSLTDGEWYWRVRVETPSLSEWSSVWLFTKDWSNTTNNPALLFPTDGASVDFYNHPIFSWNPAVGAVQYKFEIASANDFGDGTIKYTATTANTSQQPNLKLTTGNTYFWRVTPIDVGNQIGTPSEVRSFASIYSQIPQLLEPADGSFPTFTPTFKWEAVLGAQYYRLQYSSYQDFSQNVVTKDTENTSWTPTSALPNDQNYYWHVRTISGASLSDWSETRIFRKQWYLKPTLLTPIDGFQRVRFPFFSWTPAPGASYYKIEIDDDPNFGSLYETGTTSNPFYVPTKYESKLPLGEVFYWRVTPYDAQNNKGVASNSASFRSTATNTAPELIYPFYYYEPIPNVNPQEDRTASMPLLLWHQVYSSITGEIWSKAYRVQIATDPNFNNIEWQVFTQNLGAAPTIANPFPLVVGQDYYWRVIPTDEFGNPLNHTSQAWRARFNPSLWINSSAVTSPSTPPEPLRPRNGLELVEMTPVMEWKPVQGATSYEVQVSRDTAFTQVVLSDEVPYPVYAPTQALAQRNLGLYNYGTFYWRVRAMDNSVPMSGGWNTGYRFQIASQATWRLTRSRGDISNQLRVASDAAGDASATDYDLTRLNISQDKDYWYLGFPAPSLTTNTDYLVFIDLDHADGSGAATDPLGIGISTITSYRPEYVIYMDQTNQEYTPQNTRIYAWNPDSLTYDPYQTLASKGGDTFGSALYGVAYEDAVTAWAVGADGAILHWNGSSWSNESRPTTNILLDVDAVSPTFAWAVGAGGTLLQWDGLTWQKRTSPTTKTLWDVHFVSATNGWAAASAGSMLAWNGTAWSVNNITGAGDLYAMDMVNNLGLAVGSAGTWLKWETNAWVLQASFTTENLYAVSIVDDNSAWAVGSRGSIFTWNGTDWSVARAPSAGQPDLNDIQMTDANNGLAAGNSGLLLHWNGSTWSTVTTNSLLNLYALDFTADGNEALVVGESGKNLRWASGSASILESAIAGYLELRLPNTSIGMGPTTGSMSVAVVSLDGGSNTPQDTVPSNPTNTSLVNLASASERMNLRTPPDTAIVGSTPGDIRSSPSILPYFYDYPVESLWAGNNIETHQDPTFTSLVTQASSTYTGKPAYYAQTQQTWGTDLADNTYFWRVRPRYLVDNTYYAGVWSQGSSFRRVGSVPTNLKTSVTFATPTFSWDRVEGAQQYRLVVADNPGFSSPKVNLLTSENQYTPDITFQHNTTYYWKVSITRYGSVTNEGFALQQFTLQLPAPTGLRHEPEILLPNLYPYPPTLCWDALIKPDGAGNDVLAAWKYRVEISTVDTFSPLFDSVETEQQCWTSIKNFADGTYFWRVAMIDGESKRGPWSTTNQFTKLYPAPSLVSPANGSQEAATPLFVWNPVNGAATYVLEVATDNLFGNKVVSITTPNVKYMPTVKLPIKQYFWRVAIRDKAGNLGPWSNAIIQVNPYFYSVFLPVVRR